MKNGPMQKFDPIEINDHYKKFIIKRIYFSQIIRAFIENK